MKQILSRLILALALVCALGGCSFFQSPNAAFVSAMDAGLNAGPSGAAILNEYETYVDADAKLTADSKRIRHKTIDLLRKLIEDAKK